MARKAEELLVATATFACDVDGQTFTVKAGQTRVASTHPLVKGREGFFEPVEPKADIEHTATPRRRRKT